MLLGEAAEPPRWPTWTSSPPPRSRARVPVYVVFQHRHGSGARRAHQLLHSGALGVRRSSVCETLWYRPDSYFLPEWRGNWAGEGGGPTLGHGIHQIDLLLHLMGPWDDRRRSCGADRPSRRVRGRVDGHRQVRQWRRRHGRDQPALPARAQPDPDRYHRRHARGQPRLRLPRCRLVLGARAGRRQRLPLSGATRVCASDGRRRSRRRQRASDVWTASAGSDLPSNHAAQINQLVDDLLAGRGHETTLASTRPTMEFVTALYASSIECETVHRRDLTPANRFYESLSGGLPTDTITARLDAGRL